MRILLDMDEVLVDFVGGACSAWGTDREQVVQHWQAGKWDLVPPLSLALGLPQPMSNNAFWDRLRGDAFWIGLEPLPWIDDLIALVEQYTTDWHIVTAPSLCPTSYVGKIKWLRNRFGKNFDRFILTDKKHLLANSNTILIDDRETNVERFKESGGNGVLFPAHHNSLYKIANGPNWGWYTPPQLEYVRRKVLEFKEAKSCLLTQERAQKRENGERLLE